MSRLICVLALFATLTNTLVWSMDLVPHLFVPSSSHTTSSLPSTAFASQQAALPTDLAEVSGENGQDGHHCCHLDSHLDAPDVVAARFATLPRSVLNERPLSAPANGFFRSPFRPPSV